MVEPPIADPPIADSLHIADTNSGTGVFCPSYCALIVADDLRIPDGDRSAPSANANCCTLLTLSYVLLRRVHMRLVLSRTIFSQAAHFWQAKNGPGGRPTFYPGPIIACQFNLRIRDIIEVSNASAIRTYVSTLNIYGCTEACTLLVGSWKMRVVSWNVNGLRAVLKNSRKRLKAFLDALDADIVCLQETKLASTCAYSTQYSTVQ